MAEQEDDSQKTEEPTQRRLDQSREKGQVAQSQEISHWFMILAFAIIIGFLVQSMGGGLVDALYPFIEQPHAFRVDSGQLQDVLADTFYKIGLVMLLPVVVAFLAAFLSSFIQNGILISFDPITPKMEKISLMKGMKRLFSSRSLMEFTKGIAKLAIVAMVIVIVMWPELHMIPNLTALELPQFLILLQGYAFRVLMAVVSVMMVIASVDYLYQKYQHTKQMRMSKQDVKDEYKQTEGDPMIKARLRQIRMERARRRMMSAVPDADVVVTNPTHYAVALKYDPDEMEAPRLTAKGADLIAKRIRELAEEHNIPIVENPPLARVLFSAVEIEQEIPPEHYKAVAGVISYVMRLKGKMKPRTTH